MGEDQHGVAALVQQCAKPFINSQRVRDTGSKRSRRFAFSYGLRFHRLQPNQAQYLFDRLGGSLWAELSSSRYQRWDLMGERSARLVRAVRPLLDAQMGAILDVWLQGIQAGRNMAGIKFRSAVLQLRAMQGQTKVRYPAEYIKNWAMMKREPG